MRRNLAKAWQLPDWAVEALVAHTADHAYLQGHVGSAQPEGSCQKCARLLGKMEKYFAQAARARK